MSPKYLKHAHLQSMGNITMKKRWSTDSPILWHIQHQFTCGNPFLIRLSKERIQHKAAVHIKKATILRTLTFQIPLHGNGELVAPQISWKKPSLKLATPFEAPTHPIGYHFTHHLEPKSKYDQEKRKSPLILNHKNLCEFSSSKSYYSHLPSGPKH